MKHEEPRYIYLTTIYKRLRIYIGDVYRPDSVKVRVECCTSGSYTLTFLEIGSGLCEGCVYLPHTGKEECAFRESDFPKLLLSSFPEAVGIYQV